MHTSKIVAALAAAVLAAGTAASAGAAPAPAPAGAVARPVVRLITGDAVTTRQVGGRTAVTVRTLAPTGAAAAYTTATLGGDAYVFPAAAHPYLGSVLDASLFDVSAAQPDAASIPLDVTFSGARPSIPGFTTTSATATSLHGYVSSAGTRTFGAALAAQWRSDVAAGRRAPTTLFGASHLALAGAAPPVHPDFPQVTLIVKATDTTGAPLPFGFVGLVNTDDGRKFSGALTIFKGEARASVPVGDYSLIGEDDMFDPDTFALSTLVVTKPDFAVSATSRRVTLDFATATAQPSVRTPQAASLASLSVTWSRIVPNASLSFGFTFGAGDSFKIAPAPAPVHGQVELDTTWALTATPPDAAPYRYDLSFLDEGAIPADLSHTVSPSQLGLVDTRYYTDGQARSPLFGRSAFYPFDAFVFTELDPMAAPLRRLEYFAAPAAARWLDSYLALATDENPFSGFVDDQPRTHPAGTSTTLDWLRGPLAPGIAEAPADSAFFACPNCRTDTQLSLIFAGFTDTTPGHSGELSAPDEGTTVANFTLYRDGQRIAKRSNSLGGIFTVPSTAATYKAVEETFLGLDGFQRSVHAVTELTFTSAAGGAPAPSSWYCYLKGACTLVPVLTAKVPLPTDLTGTMPLGTTSFTFTIGAAAGSPAVDISSAGMSISLDGGATYRTVPVTSLGPNTFRATISHPTSDAGKLVTLRVSGSGGSGESITETVDDAYQVAAS